MSELDEVKRKIARAKAQLASAKEQRAPFNDPGVVALNQKLPALYAKEARLETRHLDHWAPKRRLLL
jgi:hypothetical protein